jgi:hypothetical protein
MLAHELPSETTPLETGLEIMDAGSIGDGRLLGRERGFVLSRKTILAGPQSPGEGAILKG